VAEKLLKLFAYIYYLMCPTVHPRMKYLTGWFCHRIL